MQSCSILPSHEDKSYVFKKPAGDIFRS
jgi:hypothetical protein